MARSHILYWIWLSLCVSPGSKASDVLLEYFDENAQKIYEAGKEDYEKLDLSEEVKARLLKKGSEEARKILFWCNDHGVRILAYDDPAFPQRLKRIGKRPVLLYCKGKDVDLNDNLLIAAVGTRRITEYGKRSAYTICHDLGCAGAVVVSGLAAGVDAVCHQGALDAGADTVAVLGCGIDITYPKENFELMEQIEKRGLVISEYKPGSRPSRSSFPIRNRIISGLSQGTLVIEADKQSGALITARCALSQGRDLFALPGMVGEQNSEGTNALLKEGALPVTDACDLLADYSLLYPHKIFIERIPIYHPDIVLSPYPRPTGKRGGTPKTADNTEASSKSPKSASKIEPSSSKEREPAASPKEEMKKPAPEAEQKKEARPRPAGANELTLKLLDLLEEAEGALSADQLCEKSGAPISSVMTTLTILEIRGYVSALPGGRFLLK
ncbi:MAG: DNA-processing protein DprA [Clostridia bacterium]|nr:DNA-processing protein DprA [Clostridia bacterium]